MDRFALINRDELEASNSSSLGLFEPRYSDDKQPLIMMPARQAVRQPLPQNILAPKLQFYLRLKYGAEGPWRHQTMAIEEAAKGNNTITTTGTGSGKSLIFMAAVFNDLLRDSNRCAVVFYPFKALGQDQTKKWYEMAKLLGLPSSAIAKIDGSVPVADRLDKLMQARILLTTPDMFHSWLMSNAQQPIIREFIRNLGPRILDELHEYDGVFGTNMTFLLRRLEYQQTHLNPALKPSYHGASGTLEDAPAFFSKLTGQSCVHIGEDMNGAPQDSKYINYIQSYSRGLDIGYILKGMDFSRHQAVVFADGRKKIEELAHEFKEGVEHYFKDCKGAFENLEESVLVYKAGLPSEEYGRLHKLIANKKARIVFATSALEAGVDVDFTVGVNLGIPLRKSELLQRMGRVGRREESLFIVISGGQRQDLRNSADLANYLNDPKMETPVQYETNRSLQIAAAQCFLHERAALKAYYAPESEWVKTNWPRGFGRISTDLNKRELVLERQEQGLFPPLRMPPQRYFPLRSVPTDRFSLVMYQKNRDSRYMGDVAAMGALKEFTPGIITRHMGQKVRVQRWEEKKNGNTQIILTPYKGNYKTSVSLYTSTKIYLRENNIIGQSFRRHLMEHPVEGGFMAHIKGMVTVSANGFREIRYGPDKTVSVAPYRYFDDHQLEQLKEIRDKELIDYGPRRHVENQTFGILIHIPERWFGEYAREQLGQDILKAYIERNRISPRDIAVASTKINCYWAEGERLYDHCLYFYETEGAQIGLLKQLPAQLRQILLSLKDGLDAAAPSKTTITRLDNMLRFVTALTTAKSEDLQSILSQVVEGEENLDLGEKISPVFTPGSRVKVKQGRTMQRQVEIILPTIKRIFNEESNAHQVIPGYLVKEADRKQFYSSGRWVTVSTSSRGLETMINKLRQEERDSEALMRRHFIPAAKIVTPLYRPGMAMDTETGKLYTVSREYGVELKKYSLPDELKFLQNEL